MPNLENPSIGQLHKKLPDLQKSSEVSDAVEKHKRLTDEKVPNTPEARLEVYMERLEEVFLNKDEETRKRNIALIRPKIHEAFVIKSEDVPESYFELQQRIARERGQPVETIPEDVREQMKDVIIEDQTQSLDAWIDYLSSDDAMYPTWFKYFVFRNITKLSQFDKEHGKFKERTKSTTAPFPDIYREPLAQLCDMYERVAKGDPATLNDPSFQEFIGKKFPAQYATLIQKTLEQAQENREQIEGKWVKYAKGDMEGAKELYYSLQGKGTGWCTAGEGTARLQVETGDFYVYYTNDTDGNPVNPRLAIRMSNNSLAEVRGVLPHQEVEPLLSDVLDAKLSEFGSEADKYKKKSVDMKRLTGLDKKVKAGEALKKEDLAFLYEIDGKIEGFGYGSDPRIKEIKQGRNLKEDLAIIFDCSPESIIEDLKLIDEQTRLYVKKHTSRSLEGEKESLIIFDLLDERNALSYIMIKKFLDIEKELKAGKTPDRDDLDYMWGGQLDDDDIVKYAANPATLQKIKRFELRLGKRKITLSARPEAGSSYYGSHLSEEVHIFHRLTKDRNRKDDFAVMQGYNPSEVAENSLDINEKTKGIFRMDQFHSLGAYVSELPEKKALILADIVKRIKESASLVQPNIEIGDGVVNVIVPQEEIKDLPTALSHYVRKEISPFHSPKDFSDEIYDLPFTTTEEESFNAVFIESAPAMSDQDVSIDAFNKELKSIGLRPATFSELLAFGIAYPHLVDVNRYIKTVGAVLSVDGETCIPKIITANEYRDEDDYSDYEPAKVLEFEPVREREIEPHYDSIYLCIYEGDRIKPTSSEVAQ